MSTNQKIKHKSQLHRQYKKIMLILLDKTPLLTNDKIKPHFYTLNYNKSTKNKRLNKLKGAVQ